MAESPFGTTEKDGPLAGLEDQSYKYNSFIYPLNLGNPGAGLNHYVIFYINETSTTQYQTRTVGGTPPPQPAVINRNAATDESLGVTGNRSRLAGVPGVTAPIPGRPEQRGQSTGTYVPIRRIATSIALPMPEDIQVNYSADWESMEMEETAAVMDAIGGEGSITDVLKAIGIRAGINITNKMEAATRLSLKDAFSSLNQSR